MAEQDLLIAILQANAEESKAVALAMSDVSKRIEQLERSVVEHTTVMKTRTALEESRGVKWGGLGRWVLELLKNNIVAIALMGILLGTAGRCGIEPKILQQSPAPALEVSND